MAWRTGSAGGLNGQSSGNTEHCLTSRSSRPPLEGGTFIRKFITGDLKRLPQVRDQLLDQIALLEHAPLATLRERGVVEHVEDDILSFRFKANIAGNIWVRLLIACWPNDRSIVILLPLLKKRNNLDPDDRRQAKKNLQILRERNK